MTKLLTTGEVARLCGFSASAVLQWLRSGKLSSYSSPGGQHRVDPEELLAFLKAHGMRVPPDLEPPATPRILIVDDEEVVREVLVRILKSSPIDCELEVAQNGVVGCMKLPTFKPHLVVLDIVMPEVDGAEMCRSIKSSEELAGTRILLVTGYPDDVRLRVALKAGADAWLPKPVQIEPFLAKVAELLGIPVPDEIAGQQDRAAAAPVSEESAPHAPAPTSPVP